MDHHFKLGNPCASRKEHCINCHSHFMSIRPLIKNVIVSKHFKRDFKNMEEMVSIINDILDCAHLESHELHKFEENIDGVLVFRAKKENMHVVYCVDKKLRITFLRAISNFTDYKRFLDNKKELRRIVKEINRL